MAKKTATQRIARLESVVIGAGFLLQQCMNRYGVNMSVGLHEQVRQCLRDCNAIEQAAEQRAKKDQHHD